MKKILFLGLLSVISTSTLAAPPQCKGTPNEHNRGHWRIYDEQVCDIRTVLIDTPKTLCEYKLNNGPPPVQIEMFKIKKVGHIQCDASITVWVDNREHPDFRSPQGAAPYGAPDRKVYRTAGLSSQTHYTAQEQKTEQYNCRIEERRVWVSHCGDAP